MLLLLISCSSSVLGPPLSGGAGWPAPEDAPVLSIVEADVAPCVVPVLGGEIHLARMPYIQNVSSSSAVIAFGTHQNNSARVSWGIGEAVQANAESNVQTLQISDSFLGEKESIQLHHVLLENLEADTSYCYDVAIHEEAVAAGKFRTAPTDPSTAIRFMVIGDFGAGTPDQNAIRDQMLAWADDTDFILTTGDNAYNVGDWDEVDQFVFGVYGELMADIPMFPSWGNHDYSTERGAPSLANFFVPENTLDPADHERYYSFDWGPIHIVMLDTEGTTIPIVDTRSDDQVDWLKADLDATDAPWVIAAMHRPAYSAHPTRPSDPLALGFFAPLLEARGAQLALQGHNHYYERFLPQIGNVPVSTADGGVTWVVTGGAGQYLYGLGTHPNHGYAESIHHFLVVDIEGCTMRIRAIDLKGQVIDDWTTDRCG